MSALSLNTVASSSSPQAEQELKLLKDSEFSSGFFKYLLNLEEENDELQPTILNVLADISTTSTSSGNIQIQRESEIELPSTNRKKQKIYLCEYNNCGKSYRSKENLNLHIQNIHQNKKPYQCSYCEMCFSHRNGRIYHERKNHTKHLPYQCTYDKCMLFFPCKSAMVAHIKSAHLHIKRKKNIKKQ